MGGATETPVVDLVQRLTDEGLISFAEAAKIYRKNFHKSTVARHHTHGVKLSDGTTVRLEAIRVGGSFCTSRAAVLRFFAAQNAAPTDASAPLPPVKPNPTQRSRAAAAATSELDAILGAI